MKKVLLKIALLLLSHTVVRAQTVLCYSDTGKDTISKAAAVLQAELKKAGNFTFSISSEQAFNGTGILLSANPAKWGKTAAPLRNMGPEGVVVKVSNKSVCIIGNTAMAVQEGVFLYLEQLGYRYYFPHPDWYIIPPAVNLYTKMDYAGQPSFDHRRIWCGYGTGSPKADADYNFWFMANRQGGSMNASFGQAYDEIVYRNEATFKKHPEWFYPKPAPGVIPTDPKFDIANEELVKFVINDVLARIEKSKQNGTADYKMISLSPSDGLGICNSPACQQFGSVTDRAFYLVNRAAKVVQQKYPGTWIGAYAYSEFLTPPNVAIEPNVFVGITTAYNTTKYSIEELVKRWSAKAGKTGMYDYFSIYSWDMDMAGMSLASRPAEVIKNIRKFYKMGAKGYEAESSTGWMSKGLGHYLAARLMWDVNLDAEKLRDEFFERCFLKAAPLMKQLWSKWEANRSASPRQNDLAEWMDLVTQASDKEKDPRVKARFFHIKSYLYYLALLRRYRENKNDVNLTQLLNYGYRMLDYSSFGGQPSLFELGNTTSIPGMKYNDPAAKWKASRAPIGIQEMDQLMNLERGRLTVIKGLKEYPLPAAFIKNPFANQWKGPESDNQEYNKLWMPHEFIMQVIRQGNENYIDFNGNFYNGSDRAITLDVTEYQQDVNAEKPSLISYSYTGKDKLERISLASLKPGYYRVKVNDPAKTFRMLFSPSLLYSIINTPSVQLNSGYCNNLYICVPTNTSSFSVWKSIEVKFQTPTGRIVDLANKKEEEVEVSVKPGEYGLWKIIFFSGALYVNGLPPVIGLNPANMLVPAGTK